ncbi:hypothetical protein [Brevundimonas naejangsanensis]|jgi:hypothetical protein
MLKSRSLIRVGSAKARTRAIDERGDLEQIPEFEYVTPGARTA